MNFAFVTNSVPQSNDGLLRFNALTPNVVRETPSVAVELSLFAPESAVLASAPAGPFRAVHALPKHADVGEFFDGNQCDLVVLDYDATAGTHRDRYAFLLLARGLLRASDGVSVAVLASESNAFPGSGHFSVAAGRNRTIFEQLLVEAPLCFSFSEAVASRLREKRSGDIQVVPAGSPVPFPRYTRLQAKAMLGFADRRDVLIGLLGRNGEFNSEWLTAACSEAFRKAPAARLLYLGPDGDLIRQQRRPIPLLDAGMPSPEDTSVRLSAMDFAIMPGAHRAEARPDHPALAACLQHGVPVVATTAQPTPDPLFGALPSNLALVPSDNLGAFIETVEAFCRGVAEDPANRQADSELTAYYQARLSSQVALEAITKSLR